MAEAFGRLPAFFFLALLLLASAAAPQKPAASDDSGNISSLGGLVWATAKEEADLLATAEAEDSTSTAAAAASVEESDEFEGGFSSLDSMLQWAIGHSDPQKLKEKVQDVQQLSANDLAKRQQEIKELMEKLKMPSDAELMQIAIADLNNSSISLEDRHRALNELLILVEPIDNSNDLNKLGGLVAIIRELNNVEPGIRMKSAWILGKASQNNPVVQKQVSVSSAMLSFAFQLVDPPTLKVPGTNKLIAHAFSDNSFSKLLWHLLPHHVIFNILELGALPKLMLMVKSNFTEEAIKALYAVSAMIRNNVGGQELFYAEAGHLMLQDIMSNSSADVRLRRKSVFLVADLAESELEQLERISKAQLPFFGDRIFLKSVVDLMTVADLDLQEKSLMAIRSLLQLTTTEALVLKDFCDLGGALERMREQLQELKTDEFQKDYARDLESLLKEVEAIFHRKLVKVN